MRKHLEARRRLRTPVWTLALSLTLGVVGCGRDAATKDPTQAIVVPEALEDFDDFFEGLNAYAQRRAHDPYDRSLAPLRAQLLAWVLDYTDARLADQAFDEAQRALEVTVGLWSPEELRAEVREPEVADRARRLYAQAAAGGQESAAAFALAVLHQFGTDADREDADAQYGQLEGWVERAAQYAAQPGAYLDLETILQESLAVFPSPWTLEKLEAHLRSRYGASPGSAPALGGAQQAEYTGYILARAHLRCDDPTAAVDALAAVAGNEETAALAAMVSQQLSAPKDPEPLRQLIAYFQPSGEAPLPLWVEVQSWAIIEHLAARLVRLEPKDPAAHLALGRAFRQQGLDGAAIGHYERAIDLQPEQFAAWPELAGLYQARLESLSASDPARAAELLPDLEAFHRDAAKRWRDRPVEPGLPQAYMTVAIALYSEGEPDASQQLAESSLAIEPTPPALDLMGTIALRRDALELARGAYERVFELGFGSAAERVHWEITAHLALSDIAAAAGDAVQGRRHLKAALRHLNGVLGYPQLDPGSRGQRHVERGLVLFALGQTQMAMTDFRSAAAFSPGRPSTFVRPMLRLVAHARHDEAIELYGRAMNEDAVSEELKLYLSLWILNLQDRKSLPPDARAREFIEGYRGEGWTHRLAAHARGELNYEALLGGAEDRGHEAEAHYYEAMRRAAKGGIEASRPLFDAVLETGMVSFYEYEMARRFLRWGSIPNEPREPITADEGALPELSDAMGPTP